MLLAGCDASVELEQEPPPPVSQEQAAEQPAPEPAPEPATPAERVEASEPVRQSRSGGYLGAVAGAYRHAREEIEILAVKQAIEHYKATTGKYPRSHEEFMEKVWKPLKTPLPEIEEGYEYQYDPEDHTLYKVPIHDE